MDGEQDGAIIIDEGGAGGGADDGGAGDEELHDQGADGGGDGAGGGDDDHAGETDEERQAREEAAGGGDRRRLPLDVRKAVREITTKDPEFAKRFPKFEKEITGALFTRQKVNEMGGLQNIASTLEAIEARGGIESIEQMAQDLEAATELEGGLERGDPAVVQGWAKDFPDGFKRSVVPMLDTLEKLDEERFEHVSSYIISKTLEKFGVLGAMSALGKAVEAKKFDEAAGFFNDIAKFFGNAKRLGANAKADPYASRSSELDTREQKIEQDRAEAFRGSVRADVNTTVTNDINKQLRATLQAMKVFKVESGTANRMRKEINAELKRLVASDPNYARQYDAVMKAGDRQRAANFIIKAAQRKLPEAIKAVVKDFNLRPSGRPGGAQQRSRSANNGRGDGGGSNTVNGVPKTSEVNFRAIDKAAWLVMKSQPHGEVPLLNGKTAKW